MQKENITTNVSRGKPSSTVKLLFNSPFGNPILNHSFTPDKVFDHILLHLLQSNMLTTYETTHVLLSYPVYPILNNVNEWLQTIDFSLLFHSIERYQTQTTIHESRVHLYVASLFFYKLHLPSAIRYPGETIRELIEI